MFGATQYYEYFSEQYHNVLRKNDKHKYWTLIWYWFNKKTSYLALNIDLLGIYC